jgi:hypothetical protein
MTPEQEMYAAAFMVAVAVDQIMEWDALTMCKPGPVSAEWFDHLKQARAAFAHAKAKVEFEAAAPASAIPS